MRLKIASVSPILIASSYGIFSSSDSEELEFKGLYTCIWIYLCPSDKLSGDNYVDLHVYIICVYLSKS